MRRSDRNKMAARILAIVLVIAMLLMSCMYLLSAFAVGSTYTVYAGELEGASAEKLDKLEDLLVFIKDNYKDEIEVDSLIDAAYNGVFDSLDRWSEYYKDEANAETFINSIENKYGGIGITMSLVDKGVLAVSVNTLGPAFAAGIRPGDIVTKIDGRSLKGLGLEEAANLARGEEGSTVKLTVLTTDGTEKEFELTRQTLSAQSVSYLLLEDKTGYIEISSFTGATAREFNIARLMLLSEGAERLVIDLRNNGGGIMSSAVQIADALMPAGNITSFEQQGEIVESFESVDNPTKKLPTAVLINGGSASASECLAAALQDSKTAVVVGTNSYGKGCAQVIASVDGENSMKLSVYYFLRPNGQRIEGKGVAPDYVVYSASGRSKEEIEAIEEDVLAMDEGRKYSQGQKGLNVLAAQQRLVVLGYNVECNAKLDEKTSAALKKIQAQYGVCPYGALDFCTIELVDRAYNEYLYGSEEDAQLTKAIEVLKNEKK